MESISNAKGLRIASDILKKASGVVLIGVGIYFIIAIINA